jgi:hypothetical protein
VFSQKSYQVRVGTEQEKRGKSMVVLMNFKHTSYQSTTFEGIKKQRGLPRQIRQVS